jgi:hypothetical protein
MVSNISVERKRCTLLWWHRIKALFCLSFQCDCKRVKHVGWHWRKYCLHRHGSRLCYSVGRIIFLWECVCLTHSIHSEWQFGLDIESPLIWPWFCSSSPGWLTRSVFVFALRWYPKVRASILIAWRSKHWIWRVKSGISRLTMNERTKEGRNQICVNSLTFYFHRALQEGWLIVLSSPRRNEMMTQLPPCLGQEDGSRQQPVPPANWYFFEDGCFQLCIKKRKCCTLLRWHRTEALLFSWMWLWENEALWMVLQDGFILVWGIMVMTWTSHLHCPTTCWLDNVGDVIHSFGTLVVENPSDVVFLWLGDCALIWLVWWKQSYLLSVFLLLPACGWNDITR